MNWTAKLKALGACSKAVEWAKAYPSLEEAWAKCERGDWMLWLAGRMSGKPWSRARRKLVLATCECARLSLPIFEARYPEDRRPRECLDLAERWGRGERVRRKDFISAADAAVYAAADAAYAAYAADAAAYAAYAADAAAYAAFAADAADAARSDTLAECAEIMRRHYPIPPEIRRKKEPVPGPDAREEVE